MNWNQALFPSLKRVDARSRKCREATLVRADGVARSASPIGRSLKKRSAKSLGLKSFAELTTPSAALRRLRAFLLMPQPPLLFKEGNVSALKQSVNSFTRSDALGYLLSAASRRQDVMRRSLIKFPPRIASFCALLRNGALRMKSMPIGQSNG